MMMTDELSELRHFHLFCSYCYGVSTSRECFVLRLAAEYDVLRTALERYGEHEAGCAMGDGCTCGLWGLLQS